MSRSRTARSNRSRNTRSNQRRRSQGERPSPADLWRRAGPLPAFEPISAPTDVGALLRSLGDPPMNHGTTAGHYFSTVVERTAAVALALALSADAVAGSDSEL